MKDVYTIRKTVGERSDMYQVEVHSQDLHMCIARAIDRTPVLASTRAWEGYDNFVLGYNIAQIENGSDKRMAYSSQLEGSRE